MTIDQARNWAKEIYGKPGDAGVDQDGSHWVGLTVFGQRRKRGVGATFEEAVVDFGRKEKQRWEGRRTEFNDLNERRVGRPLT